MPRRDGVTWYSYRLCRRDSAYVAGADEGIFRLDTDKRLNLGPVADP